MPITLRQGASLAELQRYVHELEALHGWLDADLARNCFLMGEEVGELFAAVRRLERVAPDDAAAQAAGAAAIGEELVDVLNYLLALANRLGLDLEESFRSKNLRNQSRRWD